jgi:pilus assembly protein Flp/PilA
MLARTLRAFRDDEGAATAIEYGLIAALIAVAAIGSFTILGNAIVNLMNDGTGSAATVIANQSAKLD